MSSEQSEPPILRDAPVYDRHDLEYIVTMLEIAALNLTILPDSTFTFAELLRAANAIDPDRPIDEVDARIVLSFKGLVRKGPGGRYALASVCPPSRMRRGSQPAGG